MFDIIEDYYFVKLKGKISDSKTYFSRLFL